MFYYASGWSNPIDRVVFTPNPGGKFFIMDNFDYTATSSSVPEPSTFLLFGAGLGGLAFLRRKAKK
jgi:hypothetical protein